MAVFVVRCRNIVTNSLLSGCQPGCNAANAATKSNAEDYHIAYPIGTTILRASMNGAVASREAGCGVVPDGQIRQIEVGDEPLGSSPQPARAELCERDE